TQLFCRCQISSNSCFSHPFQSLSSLIRTKNVAGRVNLAQYAAEFLGKFEAISGFFLIFWKVARNHATLFTAKLSGKRVAGLRATSNRATLFPATCAHGLRLVRSGIKRNQSIATAFNQ